MKFFLRILTIFFLALITNCSGDTFHLYKDEIAELTNPKQESITESDRDVNDLWGCQYRFKVGDWMLKKSKWGDAWGRYESWQRGKMYHGGGVALDPSTKYFQNIEMANNDKINHIIYIGPWKYSPILQKNIRFFAYTGVGGGYIEYQYESQTNENKNISEKPFSLPIKNRKGSPAVVFDRFNLCVVKWTAKYGYNAVAELEYPGFFNKIFRLKPVPTGKIIEVKD